mmetsp:Transcript_8177/g.23351  ORF Transcript_8177/g.23351 Transcript_8177/m.23351 type:complete len:217 (-) Transcript_8177:136-786(-)
MSLGRRSSLAAAALLLENFFLILFIVLIADSLNADDLFRIRLSQRCILTRIHFSFVIIFSHIGCSARCNRSAAADDHVVVVVLLGAREGDSDGNMTALGRSSLLNGDLQDSIFQISVDTVFIVDIGLECKAAVSHKGIAELVGTLARNHQNMVLDLNLEMFRLESGDIKGDSGLLGCFMTMQGGLFKNHLGIGNLVLDDSSGRTRIGAMRTASRLG